MSDAAAYEGAANPLEPEAFPELAAVLRSRTDAIMGQWDTMAREVEQIVDNLNLAEMRNHLPQLLGMLADLLEGPTRQRMQALVAEAPEHGIARFHQHYDVPQLMAEGRLLRRVILQQVQAALRRQLSEEESIGLHTGIDILLEGGILSLVTEQKEQRRRDEQRHRLSIEQVRDYAIFMVDPQGRMASWNGGVRQVLGWEEAEFLGQPMEVLFPPEDVPAAPDRELQLARDHGRAENDRWQVKRDGTRFWASGTTTAIRDENGELSGYLSVMRDLTQRKQLEEELDQAKQEAESANKAKDEFLAVLSHELRTPLTPVLLAVSVLDRHRELPADVREDVETIRRSVELEARLIDDLLDMTRIARGKLQLNIAEVDAHLVIRHALELCCRGQPQEISLDLHAQQHQVHVDPTRLQQVLWNLLNNAVKFTPADGKISVRSSNVGSSIRIEVSDNGRGIEPELLPRIFNAFEQGGSRTTRQFGGLGLGLAIAKRLMDLHGGSLTAQSGGKGQGATFTVELPIVSVAAPSAPPAESPERHGPPPRALRILLVEDHTDTATTLQELLQLDGHEVRTAADVATALELAAAHEFDLVISDLGLPDRSGDDLLRELRGRGKTMPAVALSGYGQEEDIRHSRDVGFAEHLVKPVNFQRLEQIIRQVDRA